MGRLSKAYYELVYVQRGRSVVDIALQHHLPREVVISDLKEYGFYLYEEDSIEEHEEVYPHSGGSNIVSGTINNLVKIGAGGVLEDSSKKATDFEDAGAVASHESTYNHSLIHDSSVLDGDTVDNSVKSLNDILTWNGSKWVPSAIPSGSSSPSSVYCLSDVEVDHAALSPVSLGNVPANSLAALMVVCMEEPVGSPVVDLGDEDDSNNHIISSMLPVVLNDYAVGMEIYYPVAKELFATITSPGTAGKWSVTPRITRLSGAAANISCDSGVGTIVAGNNSVTINHSLGSVPGAVLVTPSTGCDAPIEVPEANVTSTQFKVQFNGGITLGSNAKFMWGVFV